MLRGALALGFVLIAADVSGQISSTLSVVSDYRYRGISLSRDNPAAQLGLAYDDASGWYAGVFASNVEFAVSPSRQLQAVPYAGYAGRLASGLSVEFGADYAAFTGPGGYNYSEVYLGVAAENLSGRLYYAPRYFGRDANALYGEINGVQPLADRVRLLAHVGILFNRSENGLYGRTEQRLLDGRLALAIEFEQFSLQASWVGINSANTAYPIAASMRRNAAVLTLSRAF